MNNDELKEYIDKYLNLEAVDLTGKTIINRVPVNEYGQPVISYENVRALHEQLRKEFPNNKVITIIGCDITAKDETNES